MILSKKFLCRGMAIAAISLVTLIPAPAQQVTVDRIELMPNLPSPYKMLNWKRVASGYDSLVYNLNLTGQYLPLSWIDLQPTNYPNHPSFGLHSYVGTVSPTNAEAINELPSLVGAELSGIGKTNQFGRNWVLMSEEFFNRRAAENVYLNSPVTSSGDDWWYDTMPNVFFYQLYSLHPAVGDFGNQFPTIADRWLQAVNAMGGNTTPWQIPDMHHRGWRLSSMSPNNQTPFEPEAAGAIGWLLYNAYVVTGKSQYRIGAEQSMEFLNGLSSNPAYEIQLPYGAYLSARMNAELGTTYDVGKLLRWCFDFQPIRSWGAIVGTWGGYDVSGLIGEVNNTNDYAFLMNTFEQVGALVPLTRYDARFTRAIGKWVLNASNAARLFYPNELPDQNQDSETWSHTYDPAGVIAHEALRQSQSGATPFATGDAIGGGWAATNLSLYSSSHAGILGGIVDTTNVRAILRLDVLKTDWFHAPAYPSYIYYNPYPADTTVGVTIGPDARDVYDMVSKTFLATGVSGTYAMALAANSARLVVLVPAGGTPLFSGERLLVNGVVVDYHAIPPTGNRNPRIKSLGVAPGTTMTGATVQVFCTAIDTDNDSLTYHWTSTVGSISGSGATVNWTVPLTAGDFLVNCIVEDGKGGSDSTSATVAVLDSTFSIPIILGISARPGKVNLGATSQLLCRATDPKGYTLTYSWRWTGGASSGQDSTLAWIAPGIKSNPWVVCTVQNGHGGSATDSVQLEVRDLSVSQTGDLVAFFPFSGNTNDFSGFNNQGVNHGAALTADRFGRAASAYQFNGSNAFIEVPNSSSLDFTRSITVAFLMNISSFFSREQYPISHGNWQNRWKVSLTPDRHIRWTLKVNDGGVITTKDLDSHTIVSLNTYYHVAGVYDGGDMELYVNGQLDAFTGLTGSIGATTIALTIGQSLPTETGYNFSGTLDDIRVYNYALSPDALQNLNDISTPVVEAPPTKPTGWSLEQNYPNPFNPSTVIRFSLDVRSPVSLQVYDVLGREVARLLTGEMEAGEHSVVWNAEQRASGVYFYRLTAGAKTRTRMMLLTK